jgi:hypothetical protein
MSMMWPLPWVTICRMAPLGDLEESGQVGGADRARGRYDGAPDTTERGGQAGADAEAPVMTAAFIEAPAS